jgi:hypothetical protein
MRQTKPMPSIEKLRALLVYEASSGMIFDHNGALRTNESGAGYYGVFVDGRQYLAHRIIWKMIYGSDPKGEIDHINGDRRDNRPGNLRLCTSTENNRNRSLSCRNKSGVKGVSWEASRAKWRATVDQTFLGRFDSLDDAMAEVMHAREKMHGEFANHAVT